jgi:hypothetical protein
MLNMMSHSSTVLRLLHLIESYLVFLIIVRIMAIIGKSLVVYRDLCMMTWLLDLQQRDKPR